MSQKPDIGGMGHKWHLSGSRFEMQNFRTVLLITLGCYPSPLRNIGLYILMAVCPIDKCNKLWQHQHGIVGGSVRSHFYLLLIKMHIHILIFCIPRVCFSCNNFCFLPTCHSNCVTFDSVCPTSCSLCCCLLLLYNISYHNLHWHAMFLLPFPVFIHISLLVGFFQDGWLSSTGSFFIPPRRECFCVCASLQILLRPINLMLSIFVKIYCLLLSEFDIVMQFVSHFWEVAMH